MIIDKIRSDLDSMFLIHGVNATFKTEIVTERNKLEEPIKTESLDGEEIVIPTNSTQRFVDSAVGELKSGDIRLLLKADTSLKENQVITVSGVRYSLGEVTDVRAFNQLLCYSVIAERADNHGGPL